MSIPAGRDHPPLAPLPVFSFILPAYNELMNIERVTSRLLAMAGQLGEPFEIIWIDDGSTDGSGELLDRLAAQDSCIRVLHFSRNFGHMAALTAGFETARATGAVICLDADGQHPPELIPAMIEQWKSGAEIVQMVRQKTADETPFKRLSSGIFYSLLNRLSDLDLPEGAADFRLLDRQAVDALNSLPERDRFIRGLVRWIGFRQTLLPYDAPPRMAGATKYSTRKMLLFAFDGITSFSIRPLRIIFYLGVAVIFITLLYALYVLGLLIAGGFRVPGWTSLILLIMMLNGIQLVTLGIVSEYMGRVFNESKQRPVYVLRKCTNPHR
ncbi:MAG: glycosyltransferase family 2 protein [Candidatus Sumerlaeota bacterium]|nr:glycosyltransferase family 2 protein [Candidatus Sumerlaeota bacterium]